MSIWQSRKRGKMLIHSHQAEQIFEIDDIFVEKRKIGFGQFGLFAIGVDKKKLKKKVEEKLIVLCQAENCLFVQVETINYDDFSKSIAKVGSRFSSGAFKKFIVPHTALIDLSQKKDDMLAGMKPKGRYNIGLAEKKGVEVEIVEKNTKNIENFYKLIEETTSRDGFSGNSLEYYASFLAFLDKSELILASIDGKVIAGGIFTFGKKASIYYYGASTSNNKYRNLMAPYLVQWKAIQEAKKRKSKFYDFLGVASPNEENSPLAGVTSFKLKFTKDVRRVSEGFIWINKPWVYKMIVFIKNLRKRLGR